MTKKIEKAYEITDAKISFVSLVDRAANKRSFLITKAEDGHADFATYGRILKTDAEHHYVTGVVYEPMVEDTQGSYMTEEEITKAAYWFSKNGNQVDLQHSFEPFEGACVVESWVAKADFELGGELIRKGTWLMTMEVTDDAVWADIQKGDITGFSMGGIGSFSTTDVELNAVEMADTDEKKGLLAKIAAAFGIKLVEKGRMAEIYEERSRGSLFWNAMSTLEECLYSYDNATGRYRYEDNEAAVRECLSDFNAIVTDLLTNEHSIIAALSERPVAMSGRKMSGKNLDTLSGIYESLGSFLKGFEDEAGTASQNVPAEKEETEVKKSEVESIVQEAIEKALNPAGGAPASEPASPAETPVEEITREAIEKMVQDAIEKSQAEAPAVTAEEVGQIVNEAVAKAMEPILKSRGVPSNMNGAGSDPVEKSEQHYLHGIL